MQEEKVSVIQEAFQEAADLKDSGWLAYLISMIVLAILVFGLIEVIRAESLDDNSKSPAKVTGQSSQNKADLYASTDSCQFPHQNTSHDWTRPRNLPGFPGPTEPVAIDIAPSLKYAPSVKYPPQALRAYQTGTVWVRVLIDTDGKVCDAIIEQASGVDGAGFEEAALKVAYQREYEPAYYEYKPVACWVSYQVSFMLKR